MNFSDLARYKGVLVSSGFLVALIVLFAFASGSLQQNLLKSEVALSKISAYGTDNRAPTVDAFFTDAEKQELQKTNQPAFDQLVNAAASDDIAQARESAQTLVTGLTAATEKRRTLVLIAPIAIGIFALLIYLLALIPQLLRLSQDKEVQVESNQQAENILNTVSEGLFLLDKEGQIGVEQSASLKQMFRLERDLEGSFLDFIGQYVPESSVAVAKDYLDLLYGDRVKEKLVKDLNPLNQVEINIARRDGSMESRFLDFKFARVMVEGKLQHLLGSITDVTREVMLERELDANKEQQEAQLELLMSVLHIDQASLTRFYDETDAALNSINGVLQERGHSDQNIRTKLDSMAEKAHRVKGDAAALKLHSFEFSMHEFETELAELKGVKGSISGRDMLPAVGKLKEVFKELNDMKSIVSRFESVLSAEQDRTESTGSSVEETSAAPTNNPVPQGLAGELEQMAQTVAERTGVRVLLKTFGLDLPSLPEHLKTPVRDTCIQLIRNSIAHGALNPLDRLAAGKADFLTIAVSLTETDEGFTLIVRDDGEGLDKERIVAKAFEKGLIKTENPDDIPANVVNKLIFHPGFSSKDEADLDSGRGMGLSAVHSIIREAGGAMGFSQAPKKFTQFSIRFTH